MLISALRFCIEKYKQAYRSSQGWYSWAMTTITGRTSTLQIALEEFLQTLPADRSLTLQEQVAIHQLVQHLVKKNLIDDTEWELFNRCIGNKLFDFQYEKLATGIELLLSNNFFNEKTYLLIEKHPHPTAAAANIIAVCHQGELTDQASRFIQQTFRMHTDMPILLHRLAQRGMLDEQMTQWLINLNLRILAKQSREHEEHRQRLIYFDEDFIQDLAKMRLQKILNNTTLELMLDAANVECMAKILLLLERQGLLIKNIPLLINYGKEDTETIHSLLQSLAQEEILRSDHPLAQDCMELVFKHLPNAKALIDEIIVLHMAKQLTTEKIQQIAGVVNCAQLHGRERWRFFASLIRDMPKTSPSSHSLQRSPVL